MFYSCEKSIRRKNLVLSIGKFPLRKFQTFFQQWSQLLTRGGHLQGAPNIMIDLETFSILENWLPRRGGHKRRFASISSQMLLLQLC